MGYKQVDLIAEDWICIDNGRPLLPILLKEAYPSNLFLNFLPAPHTSLVYNI
jgi:hypothetical protein